MAKGLLSNEQQLNAFARGILNLPWPRHFYRRYKVRQKIDRIALVEFFLSHFYIEIKDFCKKISFHQ